MEIQPPKHGNCTLGLLISNTTFMVLNEAWNHQRVFFNVCIFQCCAIGTQGVSESKWGIPGVFFFEVEVPQNEHALSDLPCKDDVCHQGNPIGQ